MSDLGVVDPIGVPVRVQWWLDRVPRLGWVFIGLAAVDFLVRFFGILEPGFGPDVPIFSVLAYYVPRAAIVALPAIIVIRRPTAQADTPWVLYGAIVVALVRILDRPTSVLIGDLLPDNEVAPRILLGIVENLVIAWAWVTLGRGLTKLNPRDPQPVAKGLANLAVGAIVLASLLGFVGYLVSELRAGVGDLGLPAAGAAVGEFAVLGFAYLLWTLGRAFDDPSRPERATRLAGGAIAVQAIASLISAIISAFVVIFRPSQTFISPDLAVAPAYMGEIAVLLIVISFALGLADPLRPMARDWKAASEAESEPA